jgi:peptidoglycan/xylan/chitin deacetylase (PgdA/CDA1 family)
MPNIEGVGKRGDTLKKRLILLICFCLGGGFISAQVRFSDLDLSAANQLLFRVEAESPGFGTYSTLCLADLERSRIEQLTFFPEKVMLMDNKEVLQIQNRFGVFRSSAQYRAFEPIETFSSFVGGGHIEDGKLNPLQISPNGKYLLYVRPRSVSYGDLVLLDLDQSRETVISRDVEISLQSPPARWSPNSEFVIYGRQDFLYYLSLAQLNAGRMIAEEYRRVGAGKIANVRWGEDNSLYYLTRSIVYKLDSRELFTRALYSGYLKIGQIKGKIPFEFDPNFDGFWISPRGGRILLNKGGRNLFLYLLASEDYSSIGDSDASLPYLYLPRNTHIKKLLWSETGTITLLAESMEKQVKQTRIYRLQSGRQGEAPYFARLSETSVLDLALSPDRSTVALMEPGRVRLKDYETWDDLAEHRHAFPLHVLWASSQQLIIAGAHYSELWDMEGSLSRIIAVSQPEAFGWQPEEAEAAASIRVRAGGAVLAGERDARGRLSWRESGTFSVAPAATSSDHYRVYLEDSASWKYANRIMLRDSREYVTRPLVSREPAAYEDFPTRDDPLDFENFSHGSRIRQREVALVFNAVDSIEGLAAILEVLAEYRLRCTFFVNGEVIRGYPDAVREIGEAGHEVGSLFYIHFNMTDSRFQLDEGFIKRGLARNEDDYFAATGRELSLLWHAPYYFVNSDIIAASKAMNYTYIGRDLDTLDWVPETLTATEGSLYLPAAGLVERIIAKKKPGAIIPVLVGKGGNGRSDYLFQNLDLLIDRLLKRGYDIVSVSRLMEHAR